MENKQLSIGVILAIILLISMFMISKVVNNVNSNNTKKLELEKYNEYILEENTEISAQEFISLVYRVKDQNIKNKKELVYEIEKENLENSRNILKSDERNVDNIKDEDFEKISVTLKVLNPEYKDANSERRKSLEKYLILTGENILEQGQNTFSENLGKDRFKEESEDYYSSGKIKSITYLLIEEEWLKV